MTEEQIKRMANRFLGWKLPEDFRPDGGIRFIRLKSAPHHLGSSPTGTNLLDYTQAEAMVRYLLDGEPLPEVDTEKLCSSCKWYDQGLCRRYPPQAHMGVTDNQHPIIYVRDFSFPYVDKKDRCGEWVNDKH